MGMKVSLPEWKPEYGDKITSEAYSKAQNLVDRALLIYEKYCEGNEVPLYADLYSNTLSELWNKMRIIAMIAGSRELNSISWNLSSAAEMVAWDDPQRATMLYDLAGAIRGY